jgi:hypothetical protein
MIDSTSGKIAGVLMLFLLAGGASLAEAAQSVAKEDPEPWFLASREGECAPTSILGRKGPQYNDIQSPHRLVETLQAAGHKAEMKELKAGTRLAVEVRAPSAGLAVMFVKKEFCDKIAPGPGQKK